MYQALFLIMGYQKSLAGLKILHYKQTLKKLFYRNMQCLTQCVYGLIMCWISEIQSFKYSLSCMKHEISRFMQQHIQRRLIEQMRERKRYVFHIQLTHLGYVIYYKIPSKNSHIALKLHLSVSALQATLSDLS